MDLLKKYKRYKKFTFSELRLKYVEKRRRILYKRLFTDRYCFVNRSNNSTNLLLILAGFQEYYWEILLERVKVNQVQFSEGIDVCVCVPQGDENTYKLKQSCKNFNWSFLQLKEDLLAQA